VAITLDALVLPSGLIWSDEHAWSPVAQSTDYTLSGALLVEEAAKLKGRPITLVGAKDGNDYTAWVMRAQAYRGYSSLADLRAALLVAGAQYTLTLHDGRTFTAAPRHDGDGPISVEPLPVYKSLAPADPQSGSLYAVNAIRLIEV